MENNETLETTIENRKYIISNIRSNERKIDELENRISELLFERANLIKTNNISFETLCFENSIILADYSLIEKEWNERRFQSNLVRQTVSNLRNLLFDKNNELLKNFFCIHMMINNNFNYEIGGNLSFYFSDGKNTFKISFHGIDYNSHRTDLIYNRYNCHIAIYSIDNIIGEKLIYSSLDFNEIKNILSNYVANNSNFNEEEFIEKTVTSFLNDKYNYSDWYSQSHYSQQRIEDMDVILLLTALKFKI